MKKIKAISFILAYIGVYSIMDSVDAGTLDYKYAVILTIVCIFGVMAYLMCEKKKSTASRKCNGQAHKVHNKITHKHYTPKKGGVSSGI